jgi:hypothetical protein
MREIIKNRAVVQDDWTVLKLEEEQSAEAVVGMAGAARSPAGPLA